MGLVAQWARKAEAVRKGRSPHMRRLSRGATAPVTREVSVGPPSALIPVGDYPWERAPWLEPWLTFLGRLIHRGSGRSRRLALSLRCHSSDAAFARGRENCYPDRRHLEKDEVRDEQNQGDGPEASDAFRSG